MKKKNKEEENVRRACMYIPLFLLGATQDLWRKIFPRKLFIVSHFFTSVKISFTHSATHIYNFMPRRKKLECLKKLFSTISSFLIRSYTSTTAESETMTEMKFLRILLKTFLILSTLHTFLSFIHPFIHLVSNERERKSIQ